MRFKDKIVLITGSAGGIGFKTALDFGNEGAIVAVTDIDFEMAKKLSNQIIINGGIAEPLQLDVTNLEQTKNVFEVLNQKYGVCDIVFCNAAILSRGILAKEKNIFWFSCIEDKPKAIYGLGYIIH